MQTEVLDGCEIGVPYLESFSAAGEPAERTPLTSIPFTIGRIESVDLPIDSSSVSREHAVITKEGGVYRIRDLRSTNGTLVNGKLIDESILQDGDVLTIADEAFSFVCPGQKQMNPMATQVMAGPAPQESSDPSIRDQVLGMRRVRESLLHQAFDVELRPIVHLANDELFGYSEVAHRDADTLGFSGDIDLNPPCRLTMLFRQMIRTTSVDHFMKADQGSCLFLNIGEEELDHPTELRSHLARLTDPLRSSMTLIAQFPTTVADALSHQQELCDSLEEMGIELAFADVVFNRRLLPSFEKTRPSFIIISPRMIRGLSRNHQQQKPLASLLAACDEIGCQTIADGATTPDLRRSCQQLGIELGFE